MNPEGARDTKIHQIQVRQALRAGLVEEDILRDLRQPRIDPGDYGVGWVKGLAGQILIITRELDFKRQRITAIEMELISGIHLD